MKRGASSSVILYLWFRWGMQSRRSLRTEGGVAGLELGLWRYMESQGSRVIPIFLGDGYIIGKSYRRAS